MAKRCLVTDCEIDAAFSCDCQGEPIFMCSSHPSSHLLVKGEHHIVSLLFKPSEIDVQNIKENFTSTISKIRNLIDESLKCTEMIIKETLKSSENLINYLEDLEFRFLKLYKKSLTSDEIDSEDFELLNSIAEIEPQSKLDLLENVYDQLTSIYNIYRSMLDIL